MQSRLRRWGWPGGCPARKVSSVQISQLSFIICRPPLKNWSFIVRTSLGNLLPIFYLGKGVWDEGCCCELALALARAPQEASPRSPVVRRCPLLAPRWAPLGPAGPHRRKTAAPLPLAPRSAGISWHHTHSGAHNAHPPQKARTHPMKWPGFGLTLLIVFGYYVETLEGHISPFVEKARGSSLFSRPALFYSCSPHHPPTLPSFLRISSTAD